MMTRENLEEIKFYKVVSSTFDDLDDEVIRETVVVGLETVGDELEQIKLGVQNSLNPDKIIYIEVYEMELIDNRLIEVKNVCGCDIYKEHSNIDNFYKLLKEL